MALTKPLARTIVPSLDPGGRTASSYQDHATASTEASTALAQAPGFGPPEAATIDTNGKLTPTVSRDVVADTFGGAASDFLDWVSLGAIPDGMTVSITAAAPARKVVLRHAMTTGDTDAGTLLLADGVNAGDQLTLGAVGQMVTLQRRGIGFYERSRAGFFVGGSTIGQASQDFGGFAVTGMGLGYRQVTDVDRTFSAADRGWIVQFVNAATARVPDPNDQSNADPTQWVKPGQIHLWECGAASLLFRRWDGATPANALGHDRALGAYAQGWLVARPVPGASTLEWVLVGLTQGPPTGGLVQRTAYWSSLTQGDLTLASTDTAVHTATTLAHAYGAGEKWIYLATFGFYGAGVATASQVTVWGVMQGTSDVEMARTCRVGAATAKGTNTLLWGNTFGGTGGSQTVRIDAANAATGNQEVVASPLLVALRLETGESYATDAGPHTETAGTFTAAVTLSYSSLASDEYEILFGCKYAASSDQTADLQLSINGTIESAVTITKTSTLPSWYGGVSSVTLSGSGSIVVQFRRNTTGTAGTITASVGTIVLLKKGAFQAAASGKSAAVSSTTAATPLTSKVNFSATLQPGWFSLVIGGAQCASAASSGAALCNGQVSQGGTLVGPAWGVNVNAAGQYTPNSQLTCRVVQPIAGTDTMDLSFASADGSTSVSAEGACVVVLSLKPVA